MTKERHLDPAGYLSERTIVAPCTPTGGALSVLRISGPLSHSILNQLSQSTVQASDERRAKKFWLRDHLGNKIDEAIVVSFFSPRSFTGEDVVELYLHGSNMIAQKILDESMRFGARIALPGEFSFRAVKNGKLQLSQAQAIKELIEAQNDFSLHLALDKLSGLQHEFLEKVRIELMQVVTLAEAGIDFSDQDLDEVSLPTLKKRALIVYQMLKRLGGSFDRGKRFVEGISLAIFGLPNAGKSSFFNALLGEDRSIVSSLAGTTRDVVRETMNLKDPSTGTAVTFRLSDTAGIRKSKDRIEEMGVERSIRAAKDADLVLVVIDGQKPTINELTTAIQEISSQKTLVFLINKNDQISPAEQVKLMDQLKDLYPTSTVLSISSVTLTGISEAAAEIAKEGARLLQRKPGEVILTQFEQVEAVNKALKSLDQAQETSDIVLFATETRHAMNELGPLLGETIPDDILGKIFSDFCIGK